MNVIEITAKSILRKQKKVESWFVSRYGMNLYRGCSHNCAYCDGRAEKYQVDGKFGNDVAVKVNALDILKRELDPARKRKPMKRGFIFVGGGVCDSYEPVELKYQLTRQALELIADYDFPVHMLTKSSHIERDEDLLRRINEKNRAIVSMSFSSVDDHISRVFEPGVLPPSRRLKTLEKFKKMRLPVGMYLMPVLPFVSDTPEQIEQSVRAAANIGIDFIIFGGMTLKSGRQQEHFMRVLRDYDESLLPKVELLYEDNPWGQAQPAYYDTIHRVFRGSAEIHRLPIRIPPAIWADFVDITDRVIIILEHIDYLLKLKEQKSPYGYAAHAISQLKAPIDQHTALQDIKGVGQSTEKLVREIQTSGTSKYYEWLLLGKKPPQ